jgi:hypothetical protein
MFPTVWESICASLLVLGIPPVAPDRSCGAVCVRRKCKRAHFRGCLRGLSMTGAGYLFGHSSAARSAVAGWLAK